MHSGGVGPMTVALLLKNTVENAKRLLAPATWRLTPLTLALESPVPADIVIASAQKPKAINLIAAEVGLKHSEVDLYGKNKAKVGLDVLKRLASKFFKNENVSCVGGRVAEAVSHSQIGRWDDYFVTEL